MKKELTHHSRITQFPDSTYDECTASLRTLEDHSINFEIPLKRLVNDPHRAADFSPKQNDGSVFFHRSVTDSRSTHSSEEWALLPEGPMTTVSIPAADNRAASIQG